MISGSVGRVHWAFTDRHGGTSAPPYDTLNLGGHVGDAPGTVAANRMRVAARLELAPGDVHYMNQVHGNDVAVIGVDAAGLGGGSAVDGVDALVTDKPGTALAALVADCVPVLLADRETGVVAAVHAGRPGVRNGVVVKAVERMLALGAEPSRTQAWLGPSVCPACYEVPEQMRADVAESAPAAWATSRTGTPALDLRAGLAQVLQGLGVRVEHVGPCTAQSPDHYSYRRDGTTGRFAGVVWVVPA